MGSAPKATARPGTSSNHIKQFHMRAAEYYRSLLTGLDRVADLVGGRLSPSPPSTDCTQPVHLTAAFTSSQIYQLDPPPPPPFNRLWNRRSDQLGGCNPKAAV